MPRKFTLFAYNLVFTLVISSYSVLAEEETNFSRPLGPIGGTFQIWTNQNYLSVSEMKPNGPGANAGLQVGDLIAGVFGRRFDRINPNTISGPARQLGDAINYAEINQIPLELMIIRPGIGEMNLTITLPPNTGLGPAYPITSPRFSQMYETSCDYLHSKIMSVNNGYIGYPTPFAGLALLGHPSWNQSTGNKPYRLSINKIRDLSVNLINQAVLVPVEARYIDGTNNPTYINTGLENWELGSAVMFLTQYMTKTGEQALYATQLQRGAELMANRIQHWKQPPAAGQTRTYTYEYSRGGTGHGGVSGDYTHQGYVGVHMAGLHLFNGLALAKRAGADLSVRPKDGHYFGYELNPGDPIPANIDTAMPESITLPRGAQDLRSLPHIDNVSASPLTKINTVDNQYNPFYYDLSLEQKFWIQWDALTRSTGSIGWVGYGNQTGNGSSDAGGRTPATLLGFKLFTEGTTLDPLDQELTERLMNYIVAYHDIHLNAHAYNLGGTAFTALLLPHFSDRDQRFFLENWKFFSILSSDPDGTLKYMAGRNFGDPYVDTNHLPYVNLALAGSVARGGLPHFKGFDQQRVFAHFRQPLMDWPTPQARRFRTKASSAFFAFDLLASNGVPLDASQTSIQWSVLSGPVTTGILDSPNDPTLNISLPEPGTYRLQLVATDSLSGLSTTEVIDVVREAEITPGFNVSGSVNYAVFTNISGSTLSNLTNHAKFPNSPDKTEKLTILRGTHRGDNYGSMISGYLVAPQSGDYRFYLAADDTASLQLNPNGPDPSGAIEIASLSAYSSSDQWDKYTSQASAPIRLEAGQVYYFQALQKESSGGDHLSIAWATPFNPSIAVIDATYLASPQSNEAINPAILSHPQSINANLGDNITLSLTTQHGEGLAFYQWRLNGKNFGSVQSSPDLVLSNLSARLAGTWDCVFTYQNTVLISHPATLSIEGLGELHSGALWQEVYAGVPGSTVSELISHPNFPYSASSSGPITQTATSSLGGDYGQRWTGWLIPTSSGRYRFYAAADDTSQLFLSPDEFESHKKLIHSITSYTSERSWSSKTPSDWIELEAGKRYYVEFLQKESSGGDHAAFTWQLEGSPNPVNGTDLIPSIHLQYAFGGTLPDSDSAPPFASNDRLTVTQGNSVVISALANDLDAQPSSLEIIAFTQPSNGIVQKQGNSFTYVPNSTASGTDSFTYTIRNRLNLTATATVHLSITRPWSDLLAWWKLNENTGSFAADASGNGHHASLAGSTAWLPIAKFASGVTISSSSHMVITDLNKSVPEIFTISAWIRPSNTSGTDAIFSIGNSSLRTVGSTISFNAQSPSGAINYQTPSGMFSSNTWTHVAFVFTPNTSGGAQFYVNGVLRASLDSTSITPAQNIPWRIGASHVSSDYFVGGLDEVRLYQRALSATDISHIASTPNNYEQWRMATFEATQIANGQISGPNADFDGDGLSSLLEYAFGTNPLSHSSGAHSLRYANGIINELGQPVLDLTATGHSNDYQAVFARRKNAIDLGLTYKIQFSANLIDWHDSIAIPNKIAEDSVMEIVSLPFPSSIPTTQGSQKPSFFRIQVRLQP